MLTRWSDSDILQPNFGGVRSRGPIWLTLKGATLILPFTRYTLPTLSGTPSPYSPNNPASVHNFTVTAVDEAGNAETLLRTSNGSGFNSYTWMVDDRAPITSFLSQPPPQ